MGRKVVRLTNLDTQGVAVVTRGANGKRFALAKGVDVKVKDLILELVEKGEMPFDEAAAEEVITSAGLDQQAGETFKAMCKLAWAFRDSDAMKTALKDGLMPMLGIGGKAEGDKPAGQDKPPAAAGDDQGKPPPPAEGRGGEQNGGDDMGAQDEENKQKAVKAAEEVAKKISEAEAVAKAAEARVAELQTKLEASLKAQEAIVKSAEEVTKKLEAQMRRTEWLSKARQELSHAPGKLEEHVDDLMKLEAVDAAMAQKHFERLAAVSKSMKVSGMFSPAGRPGLERGERVDSFSAAESKVEEIVIKAAAEGKPGGQLARARAIVELMKQDRSVYKSYLADNPAQVRPGTGQPD